MYVKSYCTHLPKIYRLTYPLQGCVLGKLALCFPAPAEAWEQEGNYDH